MQQVTNGVVYMHDTPLLKCSTARMFMANEKSIEWSENKTEKREPMCSCAFHKLIAL